eukprot:TRINITY_DN3709_c0_g1_i6.p1 TRINITY_DN3709_c0_g1~~TRINITY_DN3709_c0_g1_i6.p1  ORF type:complete len:155 (+),score=38.41 TRINITY_DN3709_c0_g1_i6:362-826(+)
MDSVGKRVTQRAYHASVVNAYSLKKKKKLFRLPLPFHYGAKEIFTTEDLISVKPESRSILLAVGHDYVTILKAFNLVSKQQVITSALKDDSPISALLHFKLKQEGLELILKHWKCSLNIPKVLGRRKNTIESSTQFEESEKLSVVEKERPYLKD